MRHAIGFMSTRPNLTEEFRIDVLKETVPSLLQRPLPRLAAPSARTDRSEFEKVARDLVRPQGRLEMLRTIVAEEGGPQLAFPRQILTDA
jgi:hypothetical protein